MSVLNYITLSHLKKVVAGIAQKFKEIEGKIDKTNTDITAINNNITSVNEEISTIKEGKMIKRGAGTESEIFNSEIENDAYLVSSASGNYSHSGGYFGESNGDYSYAEGTDFYFSGFYLKLTSSENAGISFTVSNSIGIDNGIWNANKFPSLINYYLRFNSYTIRKVVNEQKTDGIITSITIDSPFSGSNIISNKDVYLVGCIANGLSSYAKGTQAFAMGAYSHAEGNAVLSYGEYSYAQGKYTRALNTFTHAEGYGTTASGNNGSHAEGCQTTASGNNGSHAEGYGTTASGNNGSHAEGYSTNAFGSCSHSEGNLTIASNTACHVEGSLSRATAAQSHAEGTYGSFSVLLTGNADAVIYSVGSDAPYIYENAFVIGARITNPNGAITNSSHVVVDATNTNGYLTSITLDKTLDSSSSVSKSYTLHVGTLASGIGSHAEGAYTRAGGSYSHAEGLGTVTIGNYQHAQGKYNIIDGNYANIVGNGSGVSNRSNAYTLDWSGNGIYAGKLTVGIAPTNDMDVATKKYVDDSISAGSSQSDWNEYDTTSNSYIANKPAIRAGEGENSVLIGQIEQDEDAQVFDIAISTSGSTTSVSYTSDSTITLPSTSWYYYVLSYEANGLTYYKEIESIDTENNIINTTTAVAGNQVNLPAKLYYKYKIAGSKNSYAEGLGTISGGNYSHTEGYYSKSVGSSSHAEGSRTSAISTGCHAEGNLTTASGVASHSEGTKTIAYGYYSHSEGYYTTAQRRSQHVFGEYNILDVGGSGHSVKGNYIEIVGNGTSDSARSNARTLDWSGNEVLAGKLTVGVAPTADMDVATKKYVDDNAGSTDLSNYLAKNNTTSYTPTGDYNPATKKYVDDATSGITSDLSGLTDTTITTPTDGQLLKYNSTTSKWENSSISKELMIITMTSTGSGNNITYSADKTYSEISTHINNGGIPIVFYLGNCYHLEYFDSDEEEMCFSYISSNGLVIFTQKFVIFPSGIGYSEPTTQRLDVSLGISGNVIQLKNGDNTVMSSITLPVYNGGVS